MDHKLQVDGLHFNNAAFGPKDPKNQMIRGATKTMLTAQCGPLAKMKRISVRLCCFYPSLQGPST
jgi:hypothetical protein